MQFATKDGNVIMAGNATKNADVRMVGENQSTAMTTFSLAVGKRKDESTIFVDFVAFRKAADYASSIMKGDTVFVVGRVQERTYTNKDGEEKTSKNVLCDYINIMRSDSIAVSNHSFTSADIVQLLNDSGVETTSAPSATKQAANNQFQEIALEEDLPF